MTDDAHQRTKPQRVSLSQQAQKYLLGLIEAGTYRPGQQLPPESELAGQLGISRLTLREALLGLEQEGVVVRKHGVGTFVSPNYGGRLESGLERLESVLELAARQGLSIKCQALRVEQEQASHASADLLRVAVGAPLTRVSRVLAVDDAPVAYMCDIVPSALLAPTDVDAAFDGSVLELLRRKLGARLNHAVANITAVTADDDLARKLRVRPRQALLLLEETLFDTNGAVVEYSRNYFVPEFFRFHVVRR